MGRGKEAVALEDGQGAQEDIEAFLVDHAADGQQQQGVDRNAPLRALRGRGTVVRAQRIRVYAVDDEIEACRVSAQFVDGHVAQGVAVGSNQAGLAQGEAGHAAKQRVLAGHQRVGAGDRRHQWDTQRPAGDSTKEAVGQ